MKKIIVILGLLILCIVSKTQATELNDIDNHWAKENIKAEIKNGVVNGYSDNTFKPEKEITVAEYLKIIIKSGKYILVKEGLNLWPDYYISTAKANGIILEDEFEDYNKKITRNEIARITARYINVNNIERAKNIFNDLDNEYKSDVLRLVKLGVITGYDDGTYRGEKNVTRAEAITIVRRATSARKKLISNRKYNITESIKITNINKNADVNGIFEKTRYEIQNGKIIIYDNGRYSKLQGYVVDDKNINIKTVIEIIKKLVNENSYTEVAYIPFETLINQLVIFYGDNEMNVHYRNIYFSLTYYENKPYELQRISGNQSFSKECYMKLELFKLWDEFAEFEKDNLVDEYKKKKLYEILEIEFGKQNAEEILEYIIDKYEQKFQDDNKYKDISEIKKFGKYTINYYKKSGDTQKFYISKEQE